MKLKTILLLAATAFAQYGTSWIQMNNTGSETINWQFTKCYYRQIFNGDFNISIIVQGGRFNCPYSIQYNPVSGEWK